MRLQNEYQEMVKEQRRLNAGWHEANIKIAELEKKLENERELWQNIVSKHIKRTMELENALSQVLSDWNDEYRTTVTHSYDKAKKLLGEI